MKKCKPKQQEFEFYQITQELVDKLKGLGINPKKNPLDINLKEQFGDEYPDIDIEWNWHTKVIAVDVFDIAFPISVQINDYFVIKNGNLYAYTEEEFKDGFEEISE